MKFIDIPLENTISKEVMSLSDAIDKYNNLVLLGSPGSGKTSLLEKYSIENSSAFKVSVKEFLKLDVKVPENTKILLLDGLDEYRSFEKDKAFVVTELAYKLKNYSCKKLISCRELDWYGDNDNKVLQNSLNEYFEIYRISTLSKTLQAKMIGLFDSSLNSSKVVEKFSFTGLLQNPQLLKMIVQTYNKTEETLNTKKDIFEAFIKIAGKEHNPQHSSININNNDIFKYNGYLAFFYMFSDVSTFDDEFLAQISNKEFNLDILKDVVKSKLYTQDTIFIHRTIAEYLCAKFIVDYKLNTDNKLFKRRVKTLFITKYNKIVSELRGVYSWIGVLTQDMEYISVDPFYQLVYADNSFFNIEFKKEILTSIKEYSKKEPYFFNAHINTRLRGFYAKELDEFLIEEFQNSIKQSNHYLLLISHIIKDAENISSKLKDFISHKINDNIVNPYIKENLIIHFDKNDKKEILKKVLNGIIEDNEYNTLKEKLIRKLYPKDIAIEELIDAIKKYKKSNMMGQCFYLFDTKFEDKYKLVDELYKNLQELTTDEKVLSFEAREPFYSIELFIKDYFVELCLNYKEKYSAKDIYDILNHFLSYYKNHESLQFEAYTKETKEKLENSKELLEKLANNLFDIFIKERIKAGSIYFYDFDNIFSLAKPTFKSKIFLENMSEKQNETINKELFYNSMVYFKDKKLNNEFETIAKKYNLENDLELFKNPIKSKWQIESEQEQQKRDKELEQKREKNKAYFQSKTDEDILNSFNDLKWAYFFLSQGRGLIDEETKKRLESILMQLLEKYFYKDEANIEKLLPTINKHREIDMIYYEALTLNEDEIEFDTLDNDLKEYLYILDVERENIINVDHAENFRKYAEKKFALKVLRIVINKLLEDEKLRKYIEILEDIKILKNLLHFYNSIDIKKSIVENLVENIHFNVDSDDLEYIFNTYKVQEANLILKIKNEVLLNQEELIELYSKLFGYSDLKNRFGTLNSDCKIQLIYNMIIIFNDKKMLKFSSGVQTSYDQVANFLNLKGLTILNIEELNNLLEKVDKKSFWYDYILNEISKKSQNEANNFNRLKTQSLVEFINKSEILDYKDFFEEVCFRLLDIKIAIEDNRDNELELFYVKDKPKTENECRDAIVQKLKDRYEDIIVSREQQEANNRADINIKYKKDTNLEIQIECKRDDNNEIYIGIKEQLINKYFATHVNYGIYLIFYFGDKKDMTKMIDKIKAEIPPEYENNIEILILDLSKN